MPAKTGEIQFTNADSPTHKSQFGGAHDGAYATEQQRPLGRLLQSRQTNIRIAKTMIPEGSSNMLSPKKSGIPIHYGKTFMRTTRGDVFKVAFKTL